jgi:hypothetical protein
MRLTILLAPLLAFATLIAGPVAAQQNLFAPRVIVNDRVITNFEIQQRRSFLALSGRARRSGRRGRGAADRGAAAA